MRDTTAYLRYTMVGAGAILAVAHHLALVPDEVHLAFFALLVAAAGIPHGAVDHLVEERTFHARQRAFSMPRFLGSYLLQMLLYAGLWYLFPSISLLLFLLLSAWHFGESDTEPAPDHPLWSVFKALLGGWVLCFILLREPAFTANVVERITGGHPVPTWLWQWVAGHSMYLLSGLGALVVAFHALALRMAPVPRAYARWLPWCAVMAVVYFLPLLPAFALYFGGWHAINTFHHMNKHLGTRATPWKLWRRALPFTLLSATLLLATGIVWWKEYQYIDPLPVLFIFIAIITLPHLRVMTGMFRSRAAAGSV